MPPGDLYQLAIVVTALFVAPFNGLARVVVLAWIVGHAGYSLGVPEILVNMAGQACVLTIGWRHLRTWVERCAWTMSITLLAVNGLFVAGAITPWVWWWTVWFLALVQLMILTMAIDGRTIHLVTKVWREAGGTGMFRIGAQL